MKKFAKNLKYLREKNNLTQADMLSEIDIKRSTWNNYEARTSKPNIDVLMKIAKYFAFSETELLHADISKLMSLSQKINKNKTIPNKQSNTEKIFEALLNNKDEIIALQKATIKMKEAKIQALKHEIENLKKISTSLIVKKKGKESFQE